MTDTQATPDDGYDAAAYDAYGEDGTAKPSRGGRSQRRKPSGPKRPKRWVEVDEFGEPLPLTDEQMSKLRERAQSLCVWHLGRGPRTEKELRSAMTRKGVPSEMADDVLAKLAGFGYVNDEQFADNFVRSRHTNMRKGASVIRQELRRKGIDDEVAAHALEQITEESEREAATTLVTRKLRSTQSLEPAKRVQRLVAMLARKGYPPGLCFQVVREAIADEEAEASGLNDTEMPH